MSASHVDVNGREIQVGDRFLWCGMEVAVTALLPPVDHHSTYVAVQSVSGYYHVAAVHALAALGVVDKPWPERFNPGDEVISPRYSYIHPFRVFGFLDGYYVCQESDYLLSCGSFDFDGEFTLFGEDEDLRKVAP